MARQKQRKRASKKKMLKIRGLLAKLAGKENINTWLNAPNPDLDNTSPQSVIEKLGNKGAQIVIDLLEDALTGHPS